MEQAAPPSELQLAAAALWLQLHSHPNARHMDAAMHLARDAFHAGEFEVCQVCVGPLVQGVVQAGVPPPVGDALLHAALGIIAPPLSDDQGESKGATWAAMWEGLKLVLQRCTWQMNRRGVLATAEGALSQLHIFPAVISQWDQAPNTNAQQAEHEYLLQSSGTPTAGKVSRSAAGQHLLWVHRHLLPLGTVWQQPWPREGGGARNHAPPQSVGDAMMQALARQASVDAQHVGTPPGVQPDVVLHEALDVAQTQLKQLVAYVSVAHTTRLINLPHIRGGAAAAAVSALHSELALALPHLQADGVLARLRSRMHPPPAAEPGTDNEEQIAGLEDLEQVFLPVFSVAGISCCMAIAAASPALFAVQLVSSQGGQNAAAALPVQQQWAAFEAFEGLLGSALNGALLDLCSLRSVRASLATGSHVPLESETHEGREHQKEHTHADADSSSGSGSTAVPASHAFLRPHVVRNMALQCMDVPSATPQATPVLRLFDALRAQEGRQLRVQGGSMDAGGANTSLQHMHTFGHPAVALQLCMAYAGELAVRRAAAAAACVQTALLDDLTPRKFAGLKLAGAQLGGLRSRAEGGASTPLATVLLPPLPGGTPLSRQARNRAGSMFPCHLTPLPSEAYVAASTALRRVVESGEDGTSRKVFSAEQVQAAQRLLNSELHAALDGIYECTVPSRQTDATWQLVEAARGVLGGFKIRIKSAAGSSSTTKRVLVDKTASKRLDTQLLQCLGYQGGASPGEVRVTSASASLLGAGGVASWSPLLHGSVDTMRAALEGGSCGLPPPAGALHVDVRGPRCEVRGFPRDGLALPALLELAVQMTPSFAVGGGISTPQERQSHTMREHLRGGAVRAAGDRGSGIAVSAAWDLGRNHSFCLTSGRRGGAGPAPSDVITLRFGSPGTAEAAAAALRQIALTQNSPRGGQLPRLQAHFDRKRVHMEHEM